ncbi:MAG TPA: molybdopterin cofactor-binding domain-containing protein [Rectinemataceae bacterium]|nr:molybdopterin cofactor-binding domain-containing protein [Rectinemataceae bacterium]
MARKAATERLRPSSVGDFRAHGMIFAATIRSPLPCGSVRSIEFPRLPTGYRGILPSDIPGRNAMATFGTQVPVLAHERISYAGEPVALVAGPDPILLDELAASTKVICESDEGHFSWESFSSDQVAAKRVAVVGDPDLAFSIAETVLEESYVSKALEHYYSEPQGAAAAYDYDKLAVWCATQWPYHVRDSVATVLGCGNEDVSVRPTSLGVHLDGKLWYPSLLACHAALASIVCGRPVKLMLTREEDFLYSPKRARATVGIRAALGRSGDLAGLDVRIAVNVGAYAPLAEEILGQALFAATGVYSCPNIRAEAYAVTTNNPPMGAFGGLGASHSFFAVESHVNRLAASRGEDPVDWKARNVVRKGSALLTGEPLREEVPYLALANGAAAMSDYRRKFASYELVRKRRSERIEGPVRGIGLSFAYQGSGPFLSGEDSNAYTVEVTLDKELRVWIRTSAAVGSRGVLEIWRLNAAALLGVPMDSVVVVPPVTDDVPNSGPTTLSRNVTVVNRLVGRACRAIQKRRFRDPLPLTARSVYRVPRPIQWEDGRVRGSPFDTAAWAAAVVEIEIDTWTYEPRPTGVWICAEGGEIVSPERAAAALRVGATDALGACMRERLDPTDRVGSREGYLRYGIVPLHELPPISVSFIAPARKSEVKGIGELPFNTIPAAFLSAVEQATGVHVSSLPISPAELARQLEAP